MLILLMVFMIFLLFAYMFQDVHGGIVKVIVVTAKSWIKEFRGKNDN